MNTKICKDCLYSKSISKTNKNRCCSLYYNLRIQLVEKCPMNFEDSDSEWVNSKVAEDKQRGHALYVVN